MTWLRSDSTGPLRITASAAGLADATAPLRVEMPWRTLVFALGGGLLGGLARLLAGGRRVRGTRALLALALSLLVGLLVFGLAVLGVNVFPVRFEVQVGYMFIAVVSALGAWAGVAALKRVAPGT